VTVVCLQLLTAGRILAGEGAVLSQAKERLAVVLEYEEDRVVLSEACAE
jgi:hypothetical protein